MTTTIYGATIRRLLNTSSTNCQYCPTSSGYEPPHKEGGYKIWKRLALFLALPSVIGGSVLLYLKKKSAPEERPPFVKYSFLRIRTKRYPWGDGQKSLFHNPKVNALPDGYEDEEE
ncbi:cytochrome c oxidase subunit 6A1, mitochondrial-like [Anthonomus grandis grandis]|uniref:cytochrome c oxidase subunit 6A1, mitochondrial-like n=1 Tax=Anthonomus grandis grandis TaxID=2921223 RepID=UPI00216529F8|nr:cytochrome c oxidase subunit 6A1, mitochondrial-like [Anthonomus grandis grandis]